MDRAVSSLIFAGTALALVLVFHAGCSLDFDEFDTEAPDVAFPDADIDGGDTSTPDADANDIPTPDPGEIGAACDDDADCDDGTCRAGVCLSTCADDADCPAQTACYSLGDESLCAPRCSSTESCDHIEAHDDLSCVYVVETEPLGPSPHSLRRACLPDSADDGVFDGIDNCPDTQNAPQRDSTGDGVGDACSDTPLCHVDATDGLLSFDSIDYPIEDFVTPHLIDGRWLPVVGIGGDLVDDEDADFHSHTLLLDRHTGQWHDKGTIEFPGDGRFFVPTNTGGFLVAPGVRNDEAQGAWTQISPRGDISYGPPFDSYANADTVSSGAAPMRFPNGESLHLRVRETASNLHFDVLTFRDDHQFVSSNTVQSYADVDAPPRYSDFRGAPQTLRHPDGTVGIALWHPGDNAIHLLDVTAPRGAPHHQEVMHILDIPEEIELDDEDGNGGEEDDNGGEEDDNGGEEDDNGGEEDDNGGEEDDNGGEEDNDTEDLSNFDPIAVPAPGGQLYVFDRHTGRAGRFVAQRSLEAELVEPALFERTWGDFERLPDYDLDAFDHFDDFSVYVLPDATGLGIIGRPVDADANSTELQVRELYFHCHPVTDATDTSGDGVGDLVDNCPFEDNPEQADLDGDTWGDACDPDIDGDGIPNEIDYVEIEDEDDGENGEENDNDESNDSNDNDESNDNGDEVDGIIDLSRDSNNNGVPNDQDDDTDGDDIPDQYDPFPLDSSNDGTPNLWTDDASANSYTDDALRERGLDPYNFFSLPAHQEFLYLTDDGDQRSLHRASLAHPESTTSFDLPGDAVPHQLSFGPTDDTIVYLTDAPEQTNRFQVYDLAEEELKFEVELNPDQDPLPTLRSVSMIDESTAIIVHEKPQHDGWFVSEVEPGEVGYVRDGSDAINEIFDYIWYAHQYRDDDQSVTFLLAAESDCRECALPYVYHHDDDTLSLVDGGLMDIELVSAQNDLVAFMAIDDRGERTIHHLRLGASQSFASTVVDPTLDAIASVAFSQYRDLSWQPAPLATPYTMVTTRQYQQPLAVWIHLPGIDDSQRRWHQLLAIDAPVAEVAWFP